MMSLTGIFVGSFHSSPSEQMVMSKRSSVFPMLEVVHQREAALADRGVNGDRLHDGGEEEHVVEVLRINLLRVLIEAAAAGGTGQSGQLICSSSKQPTGTKVILGRTALGRGISIPHFDCLGVKGLISRGSDTGKV
mmetsp:Transcript_61696/g.183761  ORF Transcript_61696/g.183761 Transcript_61696/m.183761 type:complete len:136 (-) Transcript_61696:31-438(-)